MVFLKDRFGGVLSHLQTGEGAEGVGILQVKGQFLIGEFPVLLEHRSAKHLLGSHSLSAGVRTGCPHEFLIDEFQDAGLASRIFETCSSSFTMEFLAMGAKRLIWEVNFWRIFRHPYKYIL